MQVSPTYAREVSGNGAIAPHLGKFYGIRNGIDPELWDPQCDPFLPMPYGPENVTQGKEAARKLLRQKLNLAQVRSGAKCGGAERNQEPERVGNDGGDRVLTQWRGGEEATVRIRSE